MTGRDAVGEVRLALSRVVAFVTELRLRGEQAWRQGREARASASRRAHPLQIIRIRASIVVPIRVPGARNTQRAVVDPRAVR
jgi:hypothetical protein